MASRRGDAGRQEVSESDFSRGGTSILLIEAASAGSVDNLRTQLEMGAFVDWQDAAGQSALHHACDKGYGDVVELLLSRGADPDIANMNRATPLHTACIRGQRECVDLLLKAGASVGAQAGNGATPLHATCLEGHSECTQLMLQVGADCNAVDAGGCTPLHCACMLGFGRCVQLLLDSSAEVNARDASGATPLHSACSVGSVECTALLLAGGADVRIPTERGKTPLATAHAGGHLELVKLLAQPQLHACSQAPPLIGDGLGSVRLSGLLGSISPRSGRFDEQSDRDADRVIARLGGIRAVAETAASSSQAEGGALMALRQQVEREAERLDALRAEAAEMGGAPSPSRADGTDRARNQLATARAARDGMRTQLEGAQRRLKTLQGEGNHRHKLEMARQRQREESGISPRSVGGPSSSATFAASSADVSLEEEARRLRLSSAEIERKLAAHEERRFTLQRLANEQSFARKRLKELRGELSLLTEALSLRAEEVQAAREVMAPSRTQEVYAQRIEAIASEVQRWKASQGEVEREAVRLRAHLARIKSALAGFLVAKRLPSSTRPPADPREVRAMGEALAGHAIRAAADVRRDTELARKRGRRTAILDAAVNEAAARLRELLSHRRADTMGIAPSQSGTPRALGTAGPPGSSWLPLDRSLSRHEAQEWLLTVIEADPARASDVFQAVDEEGSGKLDRKAFLSAMLLLGMSPFGVGQAARGELFDLLDRHRSGRVAHAQLLWLLKGGALQPPELLSPRELHEQHEQLRDERCVVLAQAVVRRKLTQRRLGRATRGTVRLQAHMRGRLAKRNVALRRAVRAARLGGDVFTLTQISNSFAQLTMAGDSTPEQTTVRRADAAETFESVQGKAPRISTVELKEQTGDEGQTLPPAPQKPKSGICTLL
jgi:ankyrin repeat protein